MKSLFAFIFLFVSVRVQAAAKTWTGNTSTDWATATNWSGNALPAAGDDVTIPTSPAGGRMPTISADYTIKSITIQSGATLTQTGGVLLASGGALNVTGTYVISGGTFLSNTALTINGGGLVNQSGGTIHMATSIGTSPTDAITIAANGNFTQSAGTIDVKDFTTTAGSPNGTFTQTGGSFVLYHDFKNKGSFTSSGGTIEFAGNAGAASFPVEVTSSNTQFNHVLIDAGIDPNFANQVVSFNVGGDWTNNSSGLDLSAKAITTIFNGTGTQTIGGSQTTIFRNLSIDKTSGTVQLGINESVKNGDLTISNGTLDLSTYTLNRTTAGGTISLAVGCTLQLASNTGGQTGSNFPLNFSSVSLGATSTVEYNGSNAITQTIYAGATYGHLKLTNSSGSGSSAKTTTATITVNGTLTAGSNTVLNPGAAFLVAGTGTLTGSGTVQVTRTSATADFNTQYSISNKTLSSLTVDYTATAAQTVNALNYYNLTLSGSRTTNNVTLANSGTIGISGTFTPAASFSSGSYILTGSTVDFNSGSAQNIPAFTFNNLTVSNSNKTATGVLAVNGIFTLSSAILTTTSANLLVINDNATATGASATAYVNGPVKKVGNDAFNFPVGKSGTGYMLIGISAPSVVTDAFTAEYMRSPASALGSVSASGLNFVSNCDYWKLDRTAGSSSVDVTLSWNGYSNCNTAAYVTDLSTLTIAHYNGANWDTHGKNSTTGNVSSGTITRNSVSAFSPFALGSTGGTSNPLLVKLTNIRASIQSGRVKVEWTNLAEINIDHYEIERSPDGKDFILSGQETAYSNAGNKANYSWLDHSSPDGLVYYRVKAIGLDGHYMYSSVVQAELQEQTELLIYPNPVAERRLVLQTALTNPGLYQVRVYDINGRVIKTQELNLISGPVSQIIELPANLQQGIYSLQISGHQWSRAKTFVVK